MEVNKDKGTQTKEVVAGRAVAQSHKLWLLILEDLHGLPLPSTFFTPFTIELFIGTRFPLPSLRAPCGELLRELVPDYLCPGVSPLSAHTGQILSALLYFGHNTDRY